jgi:hypothetical protein
VSKHALITMLNELEAHQLCVCLVPLNPRMRGWNEGGCKRACVDQNPAWYRAFCAANPSSRGIRRGKLDTKIKRFNTLRALRQMIAKRPAGKYEPQLRAIARQMKKAA